MVTLIPAATNATIDTAAYTDTAVYRLHGNKQLSKYEKSHKCHSTTYADTP